MPQRTIDEAAQILGVTAAEVWRRIRRGDLAGRRPGSAREVRLLVEVPEAAGVPPTGSATARARPAPSTLARELRGDVALLVREMDAYREEADLLAREREDLRQILQGALTDLQGVRVTLPPPPAAEVPDVALGEAAARPAPQPEAVPAPQPEAVPTPAPESPVAPAEAQPEATLDPGTPVEAPPPSAGSADATVAEVAPEPVRLEAAPEQPASQYVAAGVRLHYLEWTPPQPIAVPPVILIHGISGNARNYDALTAALGDRFHIYALDSARARGLGLGRESRLPDQCVGLRPERVHRRARPVGGGAGGDGAGGGCGAGARERPPRRGAGAGAERLRARGRESRAAARAAIDPGGAGAASMGSTPRSRGGGSTTRR